MFACKALILLIFPKNIIKFCNFLGKHMHATAFLAGTDPFWKNRKRFLTQPKHDILIKLKKFLKAHDLFLKCYICKRKHFWF